jgi:glycosyltransferase involved in cell wall biosynthesis
MNQKLVSVIVPNYNYANFLKRRLDSIAYQTIKPTEIIFLDDCSIDNSLEVAKQLLKDYNITYSIVTNETNQGVFRQWLKGISLAKYDYIWIAEADDSCELELLEKLFPAFNDHEVIISYCQSQIIEESAPISGKTHRDDIGCYINPNRWLENYVNNCHDEASKYLSITSTIANASAVIIRKSALPFSKLQAISEYKMAGDWLFYLLTLFENPTSKIAYCSDVLNLWYRHNTNIWADTSKVKNAHMERLSIYKIVLHHYNLDSSAKIGIYSMLVKNYLNRYIEDNSYYRLLFSVIDLTGNKSLSLNILHVITNIKFFRICLVFLIKFRSSLKHKLKKLF